MVITKKFFIVVMMMNIEYTVVYVINYVENNFIKIIWNHNLILIIFIKENNSNNLILINLYWHCEICDKIMNENFTKNHLESKFHSSLVNSNVKRYIIPNPTPNKIDDIIRKYLIIQYKKMTNFKHYFY